VEIDEQVVVIVGIHHHVAEKSGRELVDDGVLGVPAVLLVRALRPYLLPIDSAIARFQEPVVVGAIAVVGVEVLRIDRIDLEGPLPTVVEHLRALLAFPPARSAVLAGVHVDPGRAAVGALPDADRLGLVGRVADVDRARILRIDRERRHTVSHVRGWIGTGRRDLLPLANLA
jgi:hypothetical protein